MLPKSFNFTGSKVLIIGDVMLDEYWSGDATRISPEAPVPIVLVDNKYYRAGGAANVAINMSAIGCTVDLIGIIGKDQTGTILQELLNQPPIINNLLLVEENYPTINKLRIISNNQQLFRIDREKNFDLSSFEKLVNKFEQAIISNNYKAIVLSDYHKGTLQNPQIFINKANEYKIPIIIDPKNPNFWVFKNATVLTPNFKEFQQMVDLNIHNYLPSSALYQQIIREKGHNLIKQLNLKALIITQGKHGLTLLTDNEQDQHFNPHCREVFDVTGAGDTVAAIITACIASNYTLHQAAYLATIAAGIVVSKLGTSYASMTEIIQELYQIEALQITNDTNNNLKLGIISEDRLSTIIQQRKLLGETIVLANGCFDILHAGHIHYLEKAKSFGDRLIVAVNTDESIKVLKGETRPINSLEQRMQVLAGLKAVDWVVAFGSKDEVRPGKLIANLNPDILIKSKENYNTIEEIPEYEGAAHVMNNGGQVYLLDRPLIKNYDLSSTKLIDSITIKIDPLVNIKI